MKLTTEFQPIREWAKAKGIFAKANVEKQFLKLMEEIGELSEAIQKNDPREFSDAIGDCVIVLTNLALMRGFDIEVCVNLAYSVIADRTGGMVDGFFVKDEVKG
jgi:NTP pyrophosphatase (non-canonical NTP hydrolase)